MRFVVHRSVGFCRIRPCFRPPAPRACRFDARAEAGLLRDAPDRPDPTPPYSDPGGRAPFAEARPPISECAPQNYAIIFKKPSVCAHIFIFSQKKEKPELLFFWSVSRVKP